MTSTMTKDPQAGTPVPATPGANTPPAAAPSTAAIHISDESELFTPMPSARRNLFLPDRQKWINLEALTPKDYDEVNHAAQGFAADGKTQIVDSRLWNARLTARAMRRADWTRMYKDDSTWRVLSQQIGVLWTIADTRLAAEAVAEMSGISAEARKKTEDLLGKDSPETATAGGSIS